MADPAQWGSTFARRERAVLELATAMSGPDGPLPAALIADLRAHFDERQLGELLAVAGEANFNNRVSNAAKQVMRGQ